MSTGIKVVLFGCVTIIVIGVIGMAVGGYFVKSWFQKKTETLSNVVGSEDSEYGKKVAELKQKHPFTLPPEGVITEAQLERFLTVRKSVYAVYKKYEADFKKLSEQGSKAGFSDALKGLEVVNEAKMAQAKALEEQNMGPDEYQFLVECVYKAWLGKGAEEVLHGKTVSQASAEQLKKQIDELDKQIKDPNTSASVKKQLRTVRDQLQSQLDNLPKNEEINEVDRQIASIPPENIALFKKHEKEISQYSMAGLELIGL